MENNNLIPIPGRLHVVSTDGVGLGADEIFDDAKGKRQSVINQETDAALENKYNKNETYSKQELNNLITTPNQEYVSVTATDQTTAATDVLPATGEADTIYRVGNWDGTQYDIGAYTEYAWNGSAYIPLSKKEPGIDDEPAAGSDSLVKSGGVYNDTHHFENIPLTVKTNNYNIGSDGSRVALNPNYRISGCSVSEGEKYQIIASNSSTGSNIKRAYAFYSSTSIDSNSFISGGEASGAAYNINIVVTAPQNAVLMCISEFVSTPATVNKVFDINDITHQVTDVNNKIGAINELIPDNNGSIVDAINHSVYDIIISNVPVSSASTPVYINNGFISDTGASLQVSTTCRCACYNIPSNCYRFNIKASLPTLGGIPNVRPLALITGNTSTEVLAVIGNVQSSAQSADVTFNLKDFVGAKKIFVNYTTDQSTPNNVTFYNYVSKFDALPDVTEEQRGFMTPEDKIFLDKMEFTYPLGIADNYAQYVIGGICIRNLRQRYSVEETYGSITYDETETDKIKSITLKNNTLHDISAITCIVKIKMQAGKAFCIRTQYDAVGAYLFSEINEGDTIYQRLGNGTLTTYVMGMVLKKDDDYMTILCSQNSVYVWTIGCRSTHSINDSDVVLFESDLDYLGLFKNSQSPADGYKYMKYKSRAEKLGSYLVGKTAIIYSDSLAGFIQYLYEDWGLNVYKIAKGGCRMGYETGGGAGGESGTANDLWLCDDYSIQKFREIMPQNVDYIINMTGTNGAFADVGSKAEVEFCYANKRWYDSNAASNPFDSLSDSDKLRFTSPVCYIVAFYSLAQLFPNAQAVVVEPYFNSAVASTMFTDGKWNDIGKFYDSITGRGNNAKIDNLKSIAKMMAAIFVPNNVEVGELNAPSRITDGVHPDNIGMVTKAETIANAINFII